MKKTIILFVICLSWQTNNAQTQKRNFIYTYDGMGNRIKREYFLLNCPTCRTAPNDSTKTDSLYKVAQKQNIQTLPLTEVVNVFPNPTQGNVVVAFKGEQVKNASLQIMDSKGNKISELQLNSGTEWQLDLSLLPAGNYNIVFINSNQTVIKPIIKL